MTDKPLTKPLSFKEFLEQKQQKSDNEPKENARNGVFVFRSARGLNNGNNNIERSKQNQPHNGPEKSVKPEDMSFADWKRYKAALSEPHPPPPPPTKNNNNKCISAEEEFRRQQARSIQQSFQQQQFAQMQRFQRINQTDFLQQQFQQFQIQLEEEQQHYQQEQKMRYMQAQELKRQQEYQRQMQQQQEFQHQMQQQREYQQQQQEQQRFQQRRLLQQQRQEQREREQKERREARQLAHQKHNEQQTLKKQLKNAKRPVMPPPMNAPTSETKEEKRAMWLEYRQARKPFKNREFANAKRCMQRLRKIDPKEISEKQKGQLEHAIETMNQIKAMLNNRFYGRPQTNGTAGTATNNRIPGTVTGSPQQNSNGAAVETSTSTQNSFTDWGHFKSSTNSNAGESEKERGDNVTAIQRNFVSAGYLNTNASTMS